MENFIWEHHLWSGTEPKLLHTLRIPATYHPQGDRGTETLPSTDISPPPTWGLAGLSSSSTESVTPYEMAGVILHFTGENTGHKSGWPKFNQLPEWCKWNSNPGSWPHSPTQAVTLQWAGH